MVIVVGSERLQRARVWRYGPPIELRLGTMPAFLALAALAATESAVRSVLTSTSAQRALVLCVIAIATTLPPAFAGEEIGAITAVAAGIVSLALFGMLTVAGLVALIASLYLLAAHGTPPVRAQVTALALAAALVVLALTVPAAAGSEAAVLALLGGALGPAAAFAGVARRAQREARIQAAARRAVADDLLEHTARGERARIARELHDVVAHHISMIAVQAESARVTTPGMPEQGAQRLAAIGGTARSALTEMRRLLGVLREDVEADEPQLSPQPRLHQLNELLDQARDASGSGARLILSGAPVALDPGLELAAYRIVQEALTNARRHAPGAGVDVELHYGPRALRVRVRDNGPGPPPDSDGAAGHGLAGMRERAAAVGGRLVSGPATGGGFAVEATLPLTPDEALR